MRRTPKISLGLDERRHWSEGGRSLRILERALILSARARAHTHTHTHTHRLRAYFTHFSQIIYTVYSELKSFQIVNCRNELCLTTIHYTIKGTISGCQAVKNVSTEDTHWGSWQLSPKIWKELAKHIMLFVIGIHVVSTKFPAW